MKHVSFENNFHDDCKPKSKSKFRTAEGINDLVARAHEKEKSVGKS